MLHIARQEIDLLLAERPNLMRRVWRFDETAAIEGVKGGVETTCTPSSSKLAFRFNELRDQLSGDEPPTATSSPIGLRYHYGVGTLTGGGRGFSPLLRSIGHL